MKDLTDILTIADRSGSMAAIRSDMEGGYNSFVKEQQETPGEANFNLYEFDDKYDVVYENVPAAEVPAFKLSPRGSTALLDAIGRTISARGAYYASLPEEERPERVVCIIITDGEENSSHEFKLSTIRDMVTHQQDAYGWKFVFLGANIDAISVSGGMGIRANTTMDFAANHDGVTSSYASLSRSVSGYKSKATADMEFTDEDRDAAMGKK